LIKAGKLKAETREPLKKQIKEEVPGCAMATFGAGGFVPVEHMFRQIKGVKTVVSGFAGGTT